ncbi:DUF302 domain-containing protein [Salegentibacter sp. F14]
MRTLVLFVIFNLILLGAVQTQEENVVMLMRAESHFDFDQTYSRLQDRLAERPGIKIFAEIDYSENGREKGLQLAPARLLIFGNARAGTPLMQNRQLTGLDLPLKILVVEDENGNVSLTYSDVGQLKTRHGLKSTKTLRNIQKSLKDIARGASGRNPKKTGEYKLRYMEGIESFKSQYSFQETLRRLKNEVKALEGVTLYGEIDHTKNAEKLNMGLRPATLLIFGNPEVSTRLMQQNLLWGLVLPIKMLVWRDETGLVKISYNAPDFLSRRYGIHSELGTQIDQVKLASKAAGIILE